MKAARIVKLKEPLQVQELQTPKPKVTQLLIKVQSAGVCHSDAHAKISALMEEPMQAPNGNQPITQLSSPED